MDWENLPKKDRERLQNRIIQDSELKKTDAVFYDLLDKVDDAVREKLEDAYIDYGVRAVQLAYIQGIQDAGDKTVVTEEPGKEPRL